MPSPPLSGDESAPGDFDNLVYDVVSRFRRTSDYAAISPSELISRFVLLRSTARQIVIRILDRDEADPENVFAAASEIAHNPVPKHMEQLYAKWPRIEPLRFLVWLRCEVEMVYQAMRRRLPEFSRVLARAMSDRAEEKDIKGLLRALKVGRITSRRPSKESDEDLRSVALEGMFVSYRGMQDAIGSDAIAPPTLGTLPVEADLPAPSRTWNWEELYAWELDATSREFLPMVRGATETLPQKGRGHLRDHFEKWGAEKRTGQELAYEDAHHLPAPDSGAEARLEGHLLRHRAYKRWGDCGLRFMEALAGDASVVEASMAAGVSRQTGHKYIRELRLSSKPEKK